MSFLTNDRQLLKKKYNKIWDKISNIMKKRYSTNPVYTEKYIKPKIKSNEGE